MKRIINLFFYIYIGLVSSLCLADPILDSAAQLIPQDPNHPVTELAKPAPKPNSIKIERTPEIIARSATGEMQAATMDPNGHWQALSIETKK